MKAQQHHGQEHGGHHEAGDDAHNRVGGVDEEAQDIHQTVGDEAGDGHEHQDIDGADD